MRGAGSRTHLSIDVLTYRVLTLCRQSHGQRGVSPFSDKAVNISSQWLPTYLAQITLPRLCFLTMPSHKASSFSVSYNGYHKLQHMNPWGAFIPYPNHTIHQKLERAY